MNSENFNEEKSEAFADRLVGILNSGALALVTSLGHRTGLFDAMNDEEPLTSDEIGKRTGLNERYVREWLGAMVTGDFIHYNKADKTYHLPAEHAAWLTRSSSPNNIAVFAQYIPVLAQVEEDILRCFEEGGGVPYARYPRFHHVMAEDSGQTVVAALQEHILPLAPGLVEKLEAGMDVLDVACGSGRALVKLAKAFPKSRFTGYDFSEEAVAAGEKEARRLGLSNLLFEVKDLTHWEEPEGYDLITAFDAIHDQKEPQKVLNGIAKALRKNGTFLMQDISASSHLENNRDHPIGPFLYTLSCMHCMTVSLAQGGAGLGTVWGRELAQSMLKEAGFGQVEIKQLAHDFQNDYYIVKK